MLRDDLYLYTSCKLWLKLNDCVFFINLFTVLPLTGFFYALLFSRYHHNYALGSIALKSYRINITHTCICVNE